MDNTLKTKDYSDVELKIIDAANKVFLQYGVETATMQQIAQEADISRTALHYYFRNKSQLYNCIIDILSSRIIPQLSSILSSEASVLEKIEMFVDNYIDLIIEYPMVPGFILSEMQKESNWILDALEKKISDTDIATFIIQIQQEIGEGKINATTPIDIISNVMGLCIFPIVGRHAYVKFVFDNDKDAYISYLNERKKTITNVIRAWLEPAEVVKRGKLKGESQLHF